DGLVHVLHRGAVLGAQRAVGGIDVGVLADALAARREARVLLLGLGGCHGWGSLKGLWMLQQSPPLYAGPVGEAIGPGKRKASGPYTCAPCRCSAPPPPSRCSRWPRASRA